MTTNTATFVNIFIVLLGFGAVIMVHEFSHFIVVKLSNIKVEAFSIGFPPILLSVQKIEKSIRFRILPKFFAADNKDGGERELEITKKGKHPYSIC